MPNNSPILYRLVHAQTLARLVGGCSEFDELKSDVRPEADFQNAVVVAEQLVAVAGGIDLQITAAPTLKVPNSLNVTGFSCERDRWMLTLVRCIRLYPARSRWLVVWGAGRVGFA